MKSVSILPCSLECESNVVKKKYIYLYWSLCSQPAYSRIVTSLNVSFRMLQYRWAGIHCSSTVAIALLSDHVDGFFCGFSLA